MAFRFGPTIYRDSLVYLDPNIQNSYNSSTNTLYNLNGNGYDANLYGYSGAPLPTYNSNGYFEINQPGSGITGSLLPTGSFDTNQITLEAVVYHTNLNNTSVVNPGGVQRYIGIGFNTPPTEHSIIRTAAYAGIGCIQFYIVSNTGNYYYSQAQYQLEINKWYHVVGTYDGMYLKIYKNGNEVTNAYCGPITLRTSNPDSYYFGSLTTETVVGRIAMGRIYNTAIPPSIVYRNYIYYKNKFGI